MLSIAKYEGFKAENPDIGLETEPLAYLTTDENP
jgi:hypothetical protein